MEKHYDFLIIGSGIAGLFFAQKVAGSSPDKKVAVITKKSETASSTNYAQGGIASVMADDDSFERHIQDTLECGAGVCNEKVVRNIITSGPHSIAQLVSVGVKFTRKKGHYDLGREGGHSHNRVVHAADLTGREIERALLAACRNYGNVDIFKDTMALDLITHISKGVRYCVGVYTYNSKDQDINAFLAPVTLLAAGGTGQVYYNTTNPSIATGDGIAMAYRAGARVANLEFVQFHPTTLYDPKRGPFLISEAVRGEGAYLLDSNHKRFMHRYHRMKELAPRDIVARAIDNELKESGTENVWLDISHMSAKFLKKRFPNIYKECLKRGFDITREPIPVVPAAHYMCGGVVASLNGKTDIKGLYVCGESACTGMHGANRLASNSLLEAVVMSNLAADDAVAFAKENGEPKVHKAEKWLPSDLPVKRERIIIAHDRMVLRKMMSDYLGIVRSKGRLELASERSEIIHKTIEQYFHTQPITYAIVELRNIAQVASLIIKAASRRKESRGLHYVIDYPETNDKYKRNTIIKPPNYLPRRNKL